ncbi:MAG: TolC family protein [Ferruginibacter sp.]|nr:TolC family protein [Ferruginibacter sp.]
MKTRILFLCILIIMVTLANAQSTTLTLQQSIETALEHNILTRQSELQMRNAEINYKQAKNNRLPVVESGYNYGFNSGRSIDPFTNGYINQQLRSSSVNAQAVVPVFKGFQLKNSIRQNELSFASATMEWQQRKDELTLQVILAWLQILSNEDALVLAKQQAEVTSQQVKRLEIIATEGATSPANVSDLKGQYAGDELAVITAENNLFSSIVSFTQLLNIPYDTGLKIDRSGFNDTIKMYGALPAEIYTTALQKLASVKAIELKVKTSAMAVSVAAAAFYPTVSLYGVLNTNYSSAAMLSKNLGYTELPGSDYVVVNGNSLPVITRQNKFSSQKINYSTQLNNNLASAYGVSVSIPLFNSFRTRSGVRLAKNEEKSNRLIADNIKFQLRQAVEQAYINITTTYKRYTVLQSQAIAYAESFRIAGIRFENGVINSPEYLIAKNNVDRTNAAIITTRYEYLLRMKVLDFYMGRLN